MRSAIALAFLLFATSAEAQPNSPMRFKVDRACDGNGDMCGSRIYAEGQIQPDTPDRLVAFVRQHRRDLPPSPTVSIDSLGGNMLAGMKLGQAIRDFGFDTEILGGQTCASACVLAFLGGVERSFNSEVAGGETRLGVHQFSSASGNVGDGLTQVTVVAVASFIESMGVDRKLLDVASLVPPSSIYWLTDEQRRHLRVDNSTAMQSDWRLDSDEAGNAYTHATLFLPGDRLKATYMMRRTGEEVTLRIHLVVPPHKADRLSNADFSLEDGIWLSLDGKAVFQSPPLRWVATTTTRTTEIRIPRSIIGRARKAKLIGFEFFMPNATNDMDPSLKTSSPALRRYIAAILR